MARGPSNPYAGTYSPARTSMRASELKAGLKGLKIKQPNKRLSENTYKTALPKEHNEPV